MTFARDRRMVCFDDGADRFQMRTAAIIRHDDYLLVHRATHEAFWTLPGGRVEFGESTDETLAREIDEELASTCRVGPLRFLVENFFTYDGMEVHEIGYYRDVELTGTFPFAVDEICHRMRDGGAELEFRWVRANVTTLRSYNLMPAILVEHLGARAAGFQHIVERAT